MKPTTKKKALHSRLTQIHPGSPRFTQPRAKDRRLAPAEELKLLAFTLDDNVGRVGALGIRLGKVEARMAALEGTPERPTHAARLAAIEEEAEHWRPRLNSMAGSWPMDPKPEQAIGFETRKVPWPVRLWHWVVGLFSNDWPA